MKRILLFLPLSLLAISLHAQVNLDSLYHCLDREIDRFPEYVEKHEAEVESLKQQLLKSANNNERYELAMALYDRYRAFVNDSAIHYLRFCIDMAEKEQRWSRVGESRDVTITIGRDALSFYDDSSQQWMAEPGDFEALVGNASDNITSKVKFKLK